jgi:methionyl-tRNA synthetase
MPSQNLPSPKREILVTCALPYANGHLHLGHLVGYIKADIWTRFQRLCGHTVTYVCGADAHGTPIMLRAEKEGIAPADLAERFRKEQIQDFAAFDVEFDEFHTTHSEENRQLSELFYQRLKAAGHIIQKTIQQSFDPVKEMFLPDRFVKGTCPKCKAEDQYGDSCEVCGTTYSPTELINPISVVSGATPILKSSEHLFFNLPDFEKMLREWTQAGHLQESVVKKLDEWFASGLMAWDISRDAPYFGFEIPDYPGKYFYVWLDAPIGYLASFQKYCHEHPQVNFDHYLKPDSKTELVHFIGKDIIYFHALFWPAMLAGAGFRTPTSICANGYLTVNGFKMSKSRGTYILARTYLDYCDPECLRYYYATKCNNTIEDLDLKLDDFVARVNSDLVGKLVNIGSRCAMFINKHFDNQLSSELDNSLLYSEFCAKISEVGDLYDQYEFSKAVREIMALADRANQYIDAQQPWKLIKEENQREKVQQICTTGLNLFRVLIGLITPILPKLSAKVAEFLKLEFKNWSDLSTAQLNVKIGLFEALMQRIDSKKVDQMVEASKETITTAIPANASLNIKPEISIDDFGKIDLRIARIVKAEQVPEADKLVRLEVDLGGEKRQIFAGIKSAYNPDDLVGKLTVIVANLAPRKMRFGLSEGMVLAASGPEKSGLWILHPDDGAEPGMAVK